MQEQRNIHLQTQFAITYKTLQTLVGKYMGNAPKHAGQSIIRRLSGL
jgi:hypothetical protein